MINPPSKACICPPHPNVLLAIAKMSTAGNVSPPPSLLRAGLDFEAQSLVPAPLYYFSSFLRFSSRCPGHLTPFKSPSPKNAGLICVPPRVPPHTHFWHGGSVVTACRNKVTFPSVQSSGRKSCGSRGVPQSLAPFDFAWSKTDANSLSYGVDGGSGTSR